MGLVLAQQPAHDRRAGVMLDVLGHVADPGAGVQVDRAPGHGLVAEQDAQNGCLARAIGTDQSELLPGVYFKGSALQYGLGTVVGGDVMEAGNRHFGNSCLSGCSHPDRQRQRAGAKEPRVVAQGLSHSIRCRRGQGRERMFVSQGAPVQGGPAQLATHTSQTRPKRPLSLTSSNSMPLHRVEPLL